MKQENIESPLYNISRLAVIIPIFILITGVSFKILGFSSNPVPQQVAQLEPSPTTPTAQNINPLSNVIPQSSADEPKIDLKGSWSCKMQSNTTDSYMLEIKNYNIAAVFNSNAATQHLIVKGDCAYYWKTSTTVQRGQKMCGISQYISMFDLFSQFNISSPDMLLNMLPNAVSQLLPIPKNLDLKALMKSCVKDTVADTVFIVPSNISFVDQTTPTPSQK